MRIVKREIELSFKFTLGPGEMPAEEAAVLAQLTALAAKLNKGVSTPAQEFVTALMPKEPTEAQARHVGRAMPWRCRDCTSMGETNRGASSHARHHPEHSLVVEPRA